MLQASCGKFEAVASDAAAIRYGHSMANSITNVLRSPVFCKRPKIARKNTKAAASEATEVAAKARASLRMEEIQGRIKPGVFRVSTHLAFASKCHSVLC